MLIDVRPLFSDGAFARCVVECVLTLLLPISSSKGWMWSLSLWGSLFLQLVHVGPLDQVVILHLGAVVPIAPVVIGTVLPGVVGVSGSGGHYCFR